MSITLNTADHNRSNFVTLDPGTYQATLTGARMYKNNRYESDEEVVQIELLWETDVILELDDGTEVDASIFDSWITFSFNEKANLTNRIKAILPTFNPKNNLDVTLELEEDIKNLDNLPHWRERKVDVTKFEVDGQDLFGRDALVSIELNASGYTKVTSVSPPMQTSGKKRVKKPAGAPS